MENIDISAFGMISVILLMIGIVAATGVLKFVKPKEIMISFARMSLQLGMVGFFLGFVFDMNNVYLTFGWICLMIITAVFSVIRSGKLRYKYFIIPLFGAFFISNILILLYFNTFIMGLKDIFTAKYAVVIIGMLLGNSMKANIVGISGFYENLRREQNRYQYMLSAGATKREAMAPFVLKNIALAINPTISTMATMGIVSLPGMMTGQILGGSPPMTAIKYQIAIMTAIIASSLLSIIIGIAFTVKAGFDGYGNLNENIFLR